MLLHDCISVAKECNCVVKECGDSSQSSNSVAKECNCAAVAKEFGGSGGFGFSPSGVLELLLSRFSPVSVGQLLSSGLGRCLDGQDIHLLLETSTSLHTQQR